MTPAADRAKHRGVISEASWPHKCAYYIRWEGSLTDDAQGLVLHSRSLVHGREVRSSSLVSEHFLTRLDDPVELSKRRKHLPKLRVDTRLPSVNAGKSHDVILLCEHSLGNHAQHATAFRPTSASPPFLQQASAGDSSYDVSRRCDAHFAKELQCRWVVALDDTRARGQRELRARDTICRQRAR